MKKIPEWVSNKRLVFPAKEFLEQASSQKTAEFKATVYKGNFSCRFDWGNWDRHVLYVKKF